MTISCLIPLAAVWRISWWRLCHLLYVQPINFFSKLSYHFQHFLWKPGYTLSLCFLHLAPKQSTIIFVIWDEQIKSLLAQDCHSVTLKILHPERLFGPGKSTRAESPAWCYLLFPWQSEEFSPPLMSLLQWNGEFNAVTLRFLAHSCGMCRLTVFTKSWIQVLATELSALCIWFPHTFMWFALYPVVFGL